MAAGYLKNVQFKHSQMEDEPLMYELEYEDAGLPSMLSSKSERIQRKRRVALILFYLVTILVALFFFLFICYEFSLSMSLPATQSAAKQDDLTSGEFDHLVDDPSLLNGGIPLEEVENDEKEWTRFDDDDLTDSPNDVLSDSDENSLSDLPAKLPSHPRPYSEMCYDVPEELRFDCYPSNHPSEEKCVARGCCWVPSTKASTSAKMDVPFCFYPPDYQLHTWKEVKKNEDGVSGLLELKYRSGYPEDVETLAIQAFFETESRLRIKISDANRERYEPPVPVIETKFGGSGNSQMYNFSINPKKNGFRITRRSNNDVLFDTSVGGFIFADQFLQISTLLPSSYIYGIGEHQDNLLHSTNWKQFSIYARDGVPVENQNLYGAHPFYLVMENSGMSHGIFLKNSNAMEIVVQPAPALTFRTIGGIFDFYIFFGPTPGDVVSQYTELIGRPFMPPYWSLGYHQCRYGYGTLNRTKEVWARTRDAGIPFDTQWVDLDAMDVNKDFTYDKVAFSGLPEFVDNLHLEGMRFVPLVDPGISSAEPKGSYPPYDEGIDLNVFIKKHNGSSEPFEGKVWNPVSTVWPDFTHENATIYWTKQVHRFHNEVPFDGLWIDMNEPSNFIDGARGGCPKSPLENPLYVPPLCGGKLQSRTICMSAHHTAGSHYNVHNIYGLAETISTNLALQNVTKERPFIISRSTFSGQGHFGGHWTGDIVSSWRSMKQSVAAILNFNIFGIPMVGADMCGFSGDTTPELCRRWMELGAFYPFARNHNNLRGKDQDPVALGPEVVAASRAALLTRYRLLPYLYTLFWRSNQFGETVARPLFFEFPDDRSTYAVDTQFLWGGSLMIVPVLEPEQQKVEAYFPDGLWYDYETLRQVSNGQETIELEANFDTIPVILRGGSVIPTQRPNLTTFHSRKNPFDLLVALDEHQHASGNLYWDDGVSIDSHSSGLYNYIEFAASDSSLKSIPKRSGYSSEPMLLGNVYIMGIESEVSFVSINGRGGAFEYDATSKVLTITDISEYLTNFIQIIWE